MSLESELFNLLNEREYAKALTILQQNPSLDVNALNDEGGSFFMEAVMNYTQESPERYAFIERLLANPKFEHANKPYDNTTTTPSMRALTGDEPKLAELILKYKDSKNMDVLFYKKTLTYEEQTRLISVLEKSSSPLVQGTLPDQKKVLAILLQMTVHEAIKRDDPTILQRLVDAGAKLHYPLKDKTYPMDLVKEHPELKVHQWLSNHIKQQISSNPTLTLAARSCARQHKEQEREIMAQQIERTSNAIKSLFKFFDYKEPQSSASEQPTLDTHSSGSKNPKH